MSFDNALEEVGKEKMEFKLKMEILMEKLPEKQLKIIKAYQRFEKPIESMRQLWKVCTDNICHKSENADVFKTEEQYCKNSYNLRKNRNNK